MRREIVPSIEQGFKNVSPEPVASPNNDIVDLTSLDLGHKSFKPSTLQFPRGTYSIIYGHDFIRPSIDFAGPDIIFLLSDQSISLFGFIGAPNIYACFHVTHLTAPFPRPNKKPPGAGIR